MPRPARNPARSDKSFLYAANVKIAAPRSAVSISRNASRCFEAPARTLACRLGREGLGEWPGRPRCVLEAGAKCGFHESARIGFEPRLPQTRNRGEEGDGIA